jgi:hypothetical protein
VEVPVSYRLAEVNGRSLFVGPDNEPFFLRGIYTIGYEPGQTGLLKARYGDDDFWHQRWAAHATDRARAWGFNTASEYSAWDYHPPTWFFPDPSRQMPYIHKLPLAAYILPRYGGKVPDLIVNADSDYTNYRGGALPDVFDPAFEPEVNRIFDQKRDDWIKNRPIAGEDKLLGLTLDDSDHLTGFGPGPDFPSPRVHPPIAEIVRANKESHAFRVLERTGHDDAFLAAFAIRFFEVTTKAIRKRYPDVLVFSPALNQHGGVSRYQVLHAAAAYCDVVQVAISSPAAYAETVKATLFTPLVVWETVVANPDSAIGGLNPRETPQWPYIAATQVERGAIYAHRARMFNALPRVAGVSWWRWYDHIGERQNNGLVNVRDEAYERFVAAVKEVHEELDSVDYGPVPERPPDPVPVPSRGDEYDVEAVFGETTVKGRAWLRKRG